jgi:hypothetical protein
MLTGRTGSRTSLFPAPSQSGRVGVLQWTGPVEIGMPFAMGVNNWSRPLRMVDYEPPGAECGGDCPR